MVAGGALILLYDWWFVDPIVTLVIAGYILYLSITEIGIPVCILMLGSPPQIDADQVIEEVCKLDGVQDLHHVHLWQMHENEAALDCHVVLAEHGRERMEAVKEDIKKMLDERFDIAHSSLEFEHADHAHDDAARIGHGAPKI